MTTSELLGLLKLLSALESWSFSTGKNMPDYLLDDLSVMVNKIEAEILKGKE